MAQLICWEIRGGKKSADVDASELAARSLAAVIVSRRMNI